MAEEFEHILDECIDRLLQGESVEQCLERYPEQAAELEPLLQVALATQKASSIEPRPEFRVQARQQLRSVLYRPKPEAQMHRPTLLDFAKSRIQGTVERLRARPVFQKASASIIVIALVVGLSLVIPVLLRQPAVALAEETAMKDPGVQILLAETGFQPSNVHIMAVKSDTEDIYFVQFMNPEDGAPIGTVTVNVKEKKVTHMGLVGSSGEQFTRPSGPATGVSEEDIIQIAESDPRVQEILGTGAKIGGMSYLSSPQRNVVGLELRSGEEIWVVRIDPIKGEVTSIFQS